jgi:hypothetical protein
MSPLSFNIGWQGIKYRTVFRLLVEITFTPKIYIELILPVNISHAFPGFTWFKCKTI